MDNGKIAVATSSGQQVVETDMVIVWKGGQLSFTKLPIRRVVHLIWTNLEVGDERLKEKYTVDVKIRDTIVSSKIYTYGETPTLPSVAEILEAYGYNKNNREIGGETKNLLYSDVLGYTSTPTAVEGPQTYNFELVDRVYSIKLTDVRDENNSALPEAIELTAPFGGKFAVPDMKATGILNGQSLFMKLEPMDSTIRPVNSVIDETYAVQLLSSDVTYSAKYADTAVTVTYVFVTFDGEKVTNGQQVIDRFTAPTFDYEAYANAQGYTVHRPDPRANDTASSDTTLTFECTRVAPYTITYEFPGQFVNGYTPPIEYLNEYIELPSMEFAYYYDKNPSSEVHFLDSWYDNPEGEGEPITHISPDDCGNKTLYAFYRGGKWAVIEKKYGTILSFYSSSDRFAFYWPTSGSGLVPFHLNSIKGFRDGYVLGGWVDYYGNPAECLDDAFEAYWNSMNGTFFTLIMNWVPIQHQITYVTDGGVIEYETETNGKYLRGYHSDYALELPIWPKKDGHTFAGWYDNDQFTGEPITRIEAGETGDKTFYAKWIPLP
jgi:uncharacterized repeat protein (TIGR02543 family)